MERKKRADERRRKRSALSDRGQIDWVRGEMFGPEHVIEQKEQELKEMQKDLKILKAKFDMEEESSDEMEAEPAEAGTPNGGASGDESIRVDTSASESEPDLPRGPAPESSTLPPSTGGAS